MQQLKNHVLDERRVQAVGEGAGITFHIFVVARD